MTATDLCVLTDALAFAADKHRNHRRKDVEASPYINHPIALMHVLVHDGGVTNVTVLAAALLHDTLEDTETTVEELTKRFGPEICKIVEEVTDDKTLPKAERKRLQVEHAAKASHNAQLVKLADKISNLIDILDSPPAWEKARKEQYFDWARQVVAAVRGANPALEAKFDTIYDRRKHLAGGQGPQSA